MAVFWRGRQCLPCHTLPTCDNHLDRGWQDLAGFSELGAWPDLTAGVSWCQWHCQTPFRWHAHDSPRLAEACSLVGTHCLLLIRCSFVGNKKRAHFLAGAWPKGVPDCFGALRVFRSPLIVSSGVHLSIPFEFQVRFRGQTGTACRPPAGFAGFLLLQTGIISYNARVSACGEAPPV